MAYLEIEKLNKYFGNLHVLKDVDFTLEKGEVLSVIGSSGSGKTTLLRAINFLHGVDSGKMTLDGEVLINGKSDESENALRKKRLNFGLVFQSFNLFPQYNVIKNITLAPTLLLREKINDLKKQDKKNKIKNSKDYYDEIFKNEREKIRERCITILEKIGLSDKSYSYPSELSGGQCQRVAIARALALEPKILCFDEPTSALDPELTGEVLKVIKSLKGKDRTMIIVTHEMGFAKKVSDKVLFMADGIVEEIGTPEEIFDNPKSPKLINFLSSIQNKEVE